MLKVESARIYLHEIDHEREVVFAMKRQVRRLREGRGQPSWGVGGQLSATGLALGVLHTLPTSG